MDLLSLLLLDSKKNSVLFDFDFSAIPVGAYSALGGFEIARASVAGVENGDNIFLPDLAPVNYARIGQIGSKRGLRIERAATNMWSQGKRSSIGWSGVASGGTSIDVGHLVTMTVAAPCVVTDTAHGFSTGQAIIFYSTGALPTGLSQNTPYYAIVINANTYRLATSLANALAGTAITTTGSQSGSHYAGYAVDSGGGPSFNPFHDITSGGFSKYLNAAGFFTIGQRYTTSLYALGGSTLELQCNTYDNTPHYLNGALSASLWRRFSNEYVAAATPVSVVVADARNGFGSGGETARDRRYRTDFHQIENGPRSTFTYGTRAGEQLKRPASTLIRNGRVKPIVTWVPDISAANASTWKTAGILGNIRILGIEGDPNNYIEIIIGGADHRKVKVCVAGTSDILPVALPDWAYGDTLKIYPPAGNGLSTGWYEHNGGARVSLGVGSVALDPMIVGSAKFDIFCSGTANQLQGIIQRITFLV